MEKSEMIGVIDIGSNTVRLVVYNLTDVYDFNELQNVKLPARLYQYLDEQQELSQEGINVLVEIIQLFKRIIQHYELDKIIATATAVIRQAKNQEAVLAAVEKETGIALRLLSDEEEAGYGHYAIVRTTQFSEGYTVDMGGGSTEVTYFRDNEIRYSHSFPFGVVTLKERFFENKKTNDKDAIKETKKFVTAQFASLDWIIDRNLPIIAVGGSSRNIASVHQRNHDYPIAGIHEYEMTKKDLEETKNLFCSLTLEELQNLDGLSKDRSDIIIPANITFIALYEQVNATKFVFCNKGLREGLLLEYINEQVPNTYDPESVRMATIRRLTNTYGIDAYSSSKRITLAKQIIQAIKDAALFEVSSEFENYLYYASYLYFLGSYIEEDDSPMHTFYLIANSNLNGFSHKERVALALMSSYKNKSLFNQFLKPFKEWYSDDELELIKQGGGLIKFCDALNITKINEIEKIELEKIDKKNYKLNVSWSFDPIAELYQANRQKKQLENLLDKKIELNFTKK